MRRPSLAQSIPLLYLYRSPLSGTRAGSVRSSYVFLCSRGQKKRLNCQQFYGITKTDAASAASDPKTVCWSLQEAVLPMGKQGWRRNTGGEEAHLADDPAAAAVADEERDETAFNSPGKKNAAATTPASSRSGASKASPLVSASFAVSPEQLRVRPQWAEVQRPQR